MAGDRDPTWSYTKKKHSDWSAFFSCKTKRTGLEPATSAVTGLRSNQTELPLRRIYRFTALQRERAHYTDAAPVLQAFFLIFYAFFAYFCTCAPKFSRNCNLEGSCFCWSGGTLVPLRLSFRDFRLRAYTLRRDRKVPCSEEMRPAKITITPAREILGILVGKCVFFAFFRKIAKKIRILS